MRILPILFAIFVSLWLVACGGGSKKSSPNNPSSSDIPTSVSVAASSQTQTSSKASDSKILAKTSIQDIPIGSAMTIASVLSAVDEQPLGSYIGYDKTQPDSPLFALNTEGDIILAARPNNGEVYFSTISTVQILLGSVLTTYQSGYSVTELEKIALETTSFAHAVEQYEMNLAWGLNPANDYVFQKNLESVVLEALPKIVNSNQQQAKTKSSQPKFMKLPPDRVDPDNLNLGRNIILFNILPTKFSNPLNITLETVPTKKGIGRFVAWNATPVSWDVSFTDAGGSNRSFTELMKASSIWKGSLSDGESMNIVPPNGSFGMTIYPSMDDNSRILLMSSVGLLIGQLPNNECSQALTQYATGALKEIITASKDPTPPEVFLFSRKIVLSYITNVGLKCYLLSEESKENILATKKLNKIFDWVGKFFDITAMAVQIPIWLAHMDEPISVGICVNSEQFVMSCVSSIAKIGDPPPIGAGVEGNNFIMESGIKFYDRTGAHTLMPADMNVEYISTDSGVDLANDIEFKIVSYESSKGMTYSVKSITGTPRTGIVRLSDIATEVYQDINVKVIGGRIEGSEFLTIREGETVTLPIIEADGYRPLYFNSLSKINVIAENPEVLDVSISKQNVTELGHFSLVVTIKGKKGGTSDVFINAGGIFSPVNFPWPKTTVKVDREAPTFVDGSATCTALCAPGSPFGCTNFQVDYSWTVEAVVGDSLGTRPGGTRFFDIYSSEINCGVWTLDEGRCTRMEGQPKQTVVTGTAIGGFGGANVPSNGMPEGQLAFLGLWEPYSQPSYSSYLPFKCTVAD